VNRPVRVIAAAILFLLMGIVEPAAVSEADNGNSSVTVHGTGEFADLAITVSQTEQLINQIVTVTWTGGVPTGNDLGPMAINYLQIMQCWGDDPSGPDRTQCQYGGLTGSSRGGAQVASRQVSYGPGLIDKAETILPEPGSLEPAYVPFRTPSGRVLDGNPKTMDQFDANTTNETPFGLTRADGTGLEFFEVQTSREAPGLGCGEPIAGPGNLTVGRPCWLVIVPRNDKEVDGSIRTTSQNNMLVSSPLSATNWAKRIVVPLKFLPLSAVCPINAQQRAVLGQELVADAVLNWQPALCHSKNAIFGYSQLSDDIARASLASDRPGLAFISRPVEEAPAGRTPVYAPIAVSGVTIAFAIDSQAARTAPDDVKARNGTRITELNLTPRLIAKLLTQSYRLSVPPGADYLAANPVDLPHDPEFQALNPHFHDLTFSGGLSELLLPYGRSDIATQVWEWLFDDTEARAFIAGNADPWGMKVNKFYRGMLPGGDYPKSDLHCAASQDPLPPLCAMDVHPYANDMNATARAASRGDSLGRAKADPNAVPPIYGRSDFQESGKRSLLALTDVSSALRYNLPMAKIRNPAGAFVTPTTESMLAAVDSMKAGPLSPDVLLADPQVTIPTAYPLTSVTYAAAVPTALSKAEGHDYAEFIRYAATAGQVPGLSVGQLPFGYAPMPEPLRAKALAAANKIELMSTPAPGSPAPRTTTAAPPANGVPNPPATANPTSSGGTPTPGTSPATQATPAQGAGVARYALLWMLGLGGLAAICGPALMSGRKPRPLASSNENNEGGDSAIEG
jgi:hypothetical protein